MACLRTSGALLRARDVSAAAAEEFDRPRAIDGQAYILNHLPLLHLDDDEDARALGETPQMRFGKWIESNGRRTPTLSPSARASVATALRIRATIP